MTTEDKLDKAHAELMLAFQELAIVLDKVNETTSHSIEMLSEEISKTKELLNER